MTLWCNGSASDSRSEGCVFKSRQGQSFVKNCCKSVFKKGPGFDPNINFEIRKIVSVPVRFLVMIMKPHNRILLEKLAYKHVHLPYNLTIVWFVLK